MADTFAALVPHGSTSASTGFFRVTYEIYLLIVDAFLESAHAEISSWPATWGLNKRKRFQKTLPTFTYTCDGGRIRLYRLRRLSIIAHIDRKSRSLVDRRFPRFHYHGRSAGIRCHTSAACAQFVHVCPTVDLCHVYCSNYPLSQLDPQSLDMFRVVENIHYHDILCAGVFTAMPNLKFLTLYIKPLGPDERSIFDEHGHDAILPAEKIGRIFDQHEWESICSYSSKWARGIRLFVNGGICSFRDRPVGELLFDPLAKGLPFRLRLSADDCEEWGHAWPLWNYY